MYAISVVMNYKSVPPSNYFLHCASAMVLLALSNAIGSVFGGVSTGKAKCGWIFLPKYVLRSSYLCTGTLNRDYLKSSSVFLIVSSPDCTSLSSHLNERLASFSS